MTTASDRLLAGGRPILTIGLLVVALAIGGGQTYPLFDLAVELTAIALLTVTLATPGLDRRDTRPALVIIALVALVPIAQLVPLPAAIWQQLPGRALAVAIRHGAGIAATPHPLSLTPDATWRSALAVLPGVAMFLATLRASRAERRRLMAIVVVGALAGALLGVLQVGGAGFDVFPTGHHGNFIGVFANRNHEADMLMTGMALCAPLAARSAARGRELRPLAGGLALLFAAAVIVTTSRMGALILIPALLATTSILIERPSRNGWRPGIAVLVLALLVVLLLAQNAVVQATARRFLATDDARFGFWSDSWVMARQVWPAGAGLGSFVPVYATAERLATIGAFYVNHAHNDYLELVLETGLYGAVLIVAGLALLARRAWQARHRPWRLEARAGAIGLAVLLAHSLVDYPLRTATLMTVFGLLAGLLFAPRDAFDESRIRQNRPGTVQSTALRRR